MYNQDIERSRETHTKENLYNNTITEPSPNLGKNMAPSCPLEALESLIGMTRKYSFDDTFWLSFQTKEERKNIERYKREVPTRIQGNSSRLSADFSTEAPKARKA